MMPTGYKYSAEGSTPCYADQEGMSIERDSEVRVRIKGLRGEIGNMMAIGSLKEDYLGYEDAYLRMMEEMRCADLVFRVHIF